MTKYLIIQHTGELLSQLPKLQGQPMFPVEKIMIEYVAVEDTECVVMEKIREMDLLEETLVFRSDKRYSQVEVSFFPDSHTEEVAARLLQCEGVSIVRIKKPFAGD
ncbi:MAG: hypothetical protein ACTHOB_18255 [Ginsengibacter sp.]